VARSTPTLGDIVRSMRILIYKRTHIGDPDAQGRFGIYDCMGHVRDYDFDAVIGVGGVGAEPQRFGINRKINWVGIGPMKRRRRNGRGRTVTFSYFRRWENRGPSLDSIAPHIAHRLYDRGARFILTGYTDDERAEAERILTWARRQRPMSVSSLNGLEARGCKSRCKPC
jgi:hypothetical protein